MLFLQTWTLDILHSSLPLPLPLPLPESIGHILDLDLDLVLDHIRPELRKT